MAGASFAIKAVHYAYPPLVFFYYLIAVTVSICTLQTISPKTKEQRVRRDVVLGIMVVVILAYVSFTPTRLSIPHQGPYQLTYLAWAGL